jgi:hypothetical protein
MSSPPIFVGSSQGLQRVDTAYRMRKHVEGGEIKQLAITAD